jgi:hypothetical protein
MLNFYKSHQFRLFYYLLMGFEVWIIHLMYESFLIAIIHLLINELYFEVIQPIQQIHINNLLEIK